MNSSANKNLRLEKRLRRNVRGDVFFDDLSRGLYSTDASIYQITPLGVIVPRSEDDISAALEIAGEEGVSVTARGAGTSQCGQTVGEGLIIDVSKHLNRLQSLDVEYKHAVVQPGMVLDQLNRLLAPHGLFFPVDVSTSNRATLGGMAGNNSCGAHSIRYGKMVDNVHAVDTLTADGRKTRFGELKPGWKETHGYKGQADLIESLLHIGEREADEVSRRFPRLQRRVGGYNLDELSPHSGNSIKRTINLARLLIGSEGTLAFSTSIHLNLQPLPQHKMLGVCHFPSFHEAMDSTQHIVKLDPDAVELVDRTMIELASSIPQFKKKMARFVRGEPDSLLLVEFSGNTLPELMTKLRELDEQMAALGFTDSVVQAVDPAFQQEIWEVRKSGLNIMMSMKGDGKPVSCIEDCAVELTDLAEYTARLNELFEKHGTSGTWYAHASVGCLHVRPVLNMKEEMSAKKLRAITEEAFAIVREYKGSHSGEHGDGLVRSEFLEPMYGRRLVEAFAEVKRLFDPNNLLNPGKIVSPPKMDDRSLFRYHPDYRPSSLQTALDWSAWGGFGRAVEMCNNNGACRKFSTEVMCPSYRVTRDELHLTRGRANALRLALSGQLSEEAYTSSEMYEAMRLCVGCKACRRECPTGVDMNRMKTEFLHHYRRKHGLSLRERMLAYMPRHAPLLSRISPLLHLRERVPGFASISEQMIGFSARRSLPRWSQSPFRAEEAINGSAGKPVVLFADTFSTWFEPESLRDAISVLNASGYRVQAVGAASGSGRLCCGRTFLSSGLLEEAGREARRVIEILAPFVEQNIPILGLEPSCVFTMRDDYPALIPSPESAALASHVLLLDEFLHREPDAGKLQLKLSALSCKKIWVHGHCHQKAGDAMGCTMALLGSIPELEVEAIPSSCCGMAGSFGYEKENYETSMQMAELSLLPKIRTIPQDEALVACGTSCRQQIHHGSGRQAVHTVNILRQALITGSVPDTATAT